MIDYEALFRKHKIGMGTQPVVPQLELVSVQPKVVAAFCRKYAGKLNATNLLDPMGRPLDPARFLWALSGNESSFGRNLGARFEPAYYKGGRYYESSALVKGWVDKYDHAAACSYGPWQILAVNATKWTPDQLKSDLDACSEATVEFLNSFVIGTRQARSLEQMGSTWNAGNWRDVNVPLKYVNDLANYYLNQPFPLG